MNRKRRSLDELNVLDDFLINAIVSDQMIGVPFCRKVLSVLLQRKIGKIQIIGQRTIPGITSESRGIRLDVEIIEEFSENNGIPSTAISVPNIYDLEPHLKKNDDLTRHNRYYQAKIDSRYLASGERNFNHLSNLYVITITNFDPFGCDYMMYTVQNQCMESPELDYNDGLQFIYFYTGGHKGGNEEIRKTLHYLADSRSENVTDASTEELHQYVRRVKEIPEVKMGYISMEEYVRLKAEDWIEDAKEEGREEARMEMFQTLAELLDDLGNVSAEMKERLIAEKDFKKLREWILLAAKSESIEYFMQNILL